MDLNSTYWTQRYRQGQIGWDLGMPSPPLMEYAKALDRDTRILIPGAGNAHDWVHLKEIGFTRVFALDFASEPIDHLKDRYPEWAESLIHEDFFEHRATYDLILEQTFFCALEPSRRVEYLLKMNELLNADGTLAGVLFGVEFDKTGPPFGGRKEEYVNLFKSYFQLKTMEPCYNSVGPRQGTELFFIARKEG